MKSAQGPATSKRKEQRPYCAHLTKPIKVDVWSSHVCLGFTTSVATSPSWPAHLFGTFSSGWRKIHLQRCYYSYQTLMLKSSRHHLGPSADPNEQTYHKPNRQACRVCSPSAHLKSFIWWENWKQTADNELGLKPQNWCQQDCVSIQNSISM